MRVAFALHNCFPYVRRGVERLMLEYALYLRDAGHTVDIITSKPGPRRVARDGNLTIYYEPQLTHPVLARWLPMFRAYTFIWSVARHLLARRYDVVHLWIFPYGAAAQLARWVHGTRYLYHQIMTEIEFPGRLNPWLFRRATRGADRIAALTAQHAARLTAQLGVPVEVLPPCVDMETFAPCSTRDLGRPRVFFASDIQDPHKGAYLLLRAWNEVYRRRPDAVLAFGGPFGQKDGPADGLVLRDLPRLVPDPCARAAVQLLGPGSAALLPRRYAESAVTVLPSINEAFGLVLVESLACGTPVVGSAYNGPGEIITDPRIGATVPLAGWPDLTDETRARELAEAVLATLDLAAQPETAARCRAHARRWSRETVGRELERIYRDMTA